MGENETGFIKWGCLGMILILGYDCIYNTNMHTRTAKLNAREGRYDFHGKHRSPLLSRETSILQKPTNTSNQILPGQSKLVEPLHNKSCSLK